jgi:hypothetical protein
MEMLLIYFLKSSGLLAMFYFAYILFMQKETFFTSNRWFLLSGLITSAVLPLFFITKTVIVDQSETNLHQNLNSLPIVNEYTITQTNTIDWFGISWIIYFIIGIFLIMKIFTHLISLYSFLNKRKITVNKPFAFVDVVDDVNPFSFFKYIVFNSNKYTENELNTILNHEKIHSIEKHSVDVLLAKLFCAVFWFNPFIWLYKKAIIQNLEYIADQKAIQNIEDKKAYQLTLLKVVTDQNCFSITNNFYQSLIKKRIIMLNKNQSKKVNHWKYFIIIPVLVGFVFLFQIKTQAQIRENQSTVSKANYISKTETTIDKNTADKELKEISKTLKTNYNVKMNFSNVKRNSNNEITSITATWNNNDGTNGNHVVESDVAIEPFGFIVIKEKNGKSTINFNLSDEESIDYASLSHFSDMPDAPEPPEAPEAPNMSNLPSPPPAPSFPTPPNVKFPKNPNDKKAIKKYEEEMEKYAKAWENSPEIKKYEKDMEAYSKKIEALEPDMTEYDKKMKEFEAKMEAYQEKLENYQEQLIRERENAEKEAVKDKRNNH